MNLKERYTGKVDSQRKVFLRKTLHWQATASVGIESNHIILNLIKLNQTKLSQI